MLFKMRNSYPTYFFAWCFFVAFISHVFCSKNSRNNKKINQLNITKIIVKYDRKTFLMTQTLRLDKRGNSLAFIDAHLLHDIPSDKLFVIIVIYFS